VFSETRVALISGIPGSGKTTLAKALADQSDRGVHIEADAFLRFIAHRVDPYSVESRAQAEAVARAVASCARSFAKHGYEVFVEGVTGPWQLEILDGELGPFDYIILDVDTEIAIDRMRKRGDAELEPEGVARLRRFFQKYPTVLRRHALNATGSEQAVMREFKQRRAAGEWLRQV
jgi:thymidylate kinase